MRPFSATTSRLPTNLSLTPSILDRLVDPELMGGLLHGFDLRHMIDCVRRDLEALLNTRRSVVADPEAFPEVADSVVTYGMPDMSLLTAASAAERLEIGKLVEAVVARFEPRLRDITASLVDSKAAGEEQTVSFHIQAKLAVDPSPDVSFETVLELMTGHTSIKAGEGAT